jgi:hypothetical protein
MRHVLQIVLQGWGCTMLALLLCVLEIQVAWSGYKKNTSEQAD